MHAISYQLKMQIDHVKFRWAWSGMPKEVFETYIPQNNTATKIYLFQLWGPIMLCLYNGVSFSSNLFFHEVTAIRTQIIF